MKKAKMLKQESIPEFQKSIDEMSQESKDKVDRLMKENHPSFFTLQCLSTYFNDECRKLFKDGYELYGEPLLYKEFSHFANGEPIYCIMVTQLFIRK